MPHSPCILVVDDDAAVRRVIRTVLERNGYRILEAADARMALVLYQESDQAIELVVSDIRMAGMDGNEFARRIHDLRPTQRILFATAYPGDVDNAVSSFEALTKPFSGAQLLGKVAAQIRCAAVAG